MIFMFGIIIVLFLVSTLMYYYFYLKRLIKLFTDNKKICNLLPIFLTIIILLISWPFFSITGMTMLHFLFINLFIDIICYIYKKIVRKEVGIIYKSGIISLIITAIFISYGYINMNTVYKKEYLIHTDKIDNLKIAALSDLHFGVSMSLEELQEYCKLIEDENIDLFVLVGDLVDEGTSKADMIEICKMLGDVKSTHGTYFVLGNHDPNLYSNNPDYTLDELKYNLTLNNITILEDDYIKIDNITLIGRKDRSSERKTVSQLMSNIDKDDFLLMLDHQPYEFNDKVIHDIDLSLSGHSHAGQIWPAGPLMELFKINDLNYGYKQIDNSHFITTSGMAGWKFPIRTQNHCEYLIIEVSK